MSVTDDPPKYLLNELGFATRASGEELHGSASITPPMLVPDAPHLRASILAAWADTLTGLLATRATMPRVPVTLDLDVQLYRPPPGAGTVHGTARTVKVGSSVFVAEVEFTSSAGEPFGLASAAFMMAPDARLRLPSGFSVEMPLLPESLAVPFAERASCERRSAGVALLHRSEDGLNASGTINGGLLALAVEEAALSTAPGHTLCSLGLRYLQPARVGPIIASATCRDQVGRVELRDTGNDNRLTGLATTRTFPV